MNEVLNTIAERSSIRAYTYERLTDEEIRALVTAGLQAPTARNEREIHFTVLDGKNPLLAEIDRECKISMLEGITDDETIKKIENNPNNFYYGAPTVVILSVKKDFFWNKLDAGIAVENMSLAAQSMGLGNLIIGIINKAMHGEKSGYFAQKLNFPENYEFAIAFAVGHKNTEKAPHEIDFDKNVSFV